MLFDQPVSPKRETVQLDIALGRVTAYDVHANIPVPPFDRSPFDGYAFRGDDTCAATPETPVILKITEEIPAGAQPQYEIIPGYAAKILTGAPMPKGADTTVKYENTESISDTVRILSPVAPDTNVVRAGSDIAQGTVIAQAGMVITSPVISNFANQGLPTVDVFAKPVITVISTGSELCEIGEVLPPAAIYNSNVHTLMGYLAEVGVNPVNGGAVEDSPVAIAERIQAALEQSDMVITTGGASVGDYDFALKSAEMLGADVLFWKASMKPGGAIVAAVWNGKVILSLSGNPAAAVVGLLRVAMPYIKKLTGRHDCFFPEIQVKLKDPLQKESVDKSRILRGRLEIHDATAYFAESQGRGSEKVSAFIGCDLLGDIPQGSPPLERGAVIKAYRLC